ncbi:hypothetical protein EMCRGX_G026438 [Ephydatia muelleri]
MDKPYSLLLHLVSEAIQCTVKQSASSSPHTKWRHQRPSTTYMRRAEDSSWLTISRIFLHLYASTLDGPGTCCLDRSAGLGDVHKCEGLMSMNYNGLRASGSQLFEHAICTSAFVGSPLHWCVPYSQALMSFLQLWCS